MLQKSVNFNKNGNGEAMQVTLPNYFGNLIQADKRFVSKDDELHLFFEEQESSQDISKVRSLYLWLDDGVDSMVDCSKIAGYVYRNGEQRRVLGTVI